jgi:hypothetical protein
MFEPLRSVVKGTTVVYTLHAERRAISGAAKESPHRRRYDSRCSPTWRLHSSGKPLRGAYINDGIADKGAAEHEFLEAAPLCRLRIQRANLSYDFRKKAVAQDIGRLN